MKVKLFVFFPISHFIDDLTYSIIIDYLNFNDVQLVNIYQTKLDYGCVVLEIIYNYDLVIFNGY